MSLKDPNIVNPKKTKRVAMVLSNPAVSTTTGWPVGFWSSFAVIINAVFLQSDRGIYEPEQLSAKLQRTQQSLKFEGESLQDKIDSASIRY